MKRLIMHLSLFFFLVTCQLSLITSLPAWCRPLPFVLVVCVYTIQHAGLRSAAWWMVGFGVILDVFRMGEVIGETLVWTVGAWTAVTTADRLFSNRSFYGVLGCLVVSGAAMTTVEVALLGFRWLWHPAWVAFSAFGISRIHAAGLGFLFLCFLFVFSGFFRPWLQGLLRAKPTLL